MAVFGPGARGTQEAAAVGTWGCRARGVRGAGVCVRGEIQCPYLPAQGNWKRRCNTTHTKHWARGWIDCLGDSAVRQLNTLAAFTRQATSSAHLHTHVTPAHLRECVSVRLRHRGTSLADGLPHRRGEAVGLALGLRGAECGGLGGGKLLRLTGLGGLCGRVVGAAGRRVRAAGSMVLLLRGCHQLARYGKPRSAKCLTKGSH